MAWATINLTVDAGGGRRAGSHIVLRGRVLGIFLYVDEVVTMSEPPRRKAWETVGAPQLLVIGSYRMIYLMSGWLTKKYPGVDPLGHDFGHLWYSLLGFKGDPHLNPIHIASNLMILGGFMLLASAWKVLYQAQQTRTLATAGSLRPRPSPAIRGVHPHHGWLPPAVADARDAGHVSDPRNDVCAARASRGARGARNLRNGLERVRRPDSGVCAAVVA